ncbi:MAG: hypothetical protein L0H75_09785 [Nitrosospira sp.]|nr:hypothetical protein [Nitrosospira sp.]
MICLIQHRSPGVAGVYSSYTLLHQAHPTEEDVAVFLTTIWYRALYLANPPDDFLGRLAGCKAVGLPGARQT